MSGDDRTLPRCSGITANGTRCERVVSREGELCYSHDPTHREARRATASKAGKLSRKGNPIGEIVGLRQRLDEILEDVLSGELTTGKGQVAATIIGTALRSFEVEKKQKEYLELEKRLSEVEKMYARKGEPTDNDGYNFGSGRWVR